MRLFRVYRGLPRARGRQPGHPLTVSPVQGAGRIDNPEHYKVLYAGRSASGAVGETLGRFREWMPSLLGERPYLPGSRLRLATLDLDRVLCDLDDPAELHARNLRPSRVVTRDRAVTQAWALDIHGDQAYRGTQWWSFWNPDWTSAGVWAVEDLRVTSIEDLSLDHPAVAEAASVLDRPVRVGF